MDWAEDVTGITVVVIEEEDGYDELDGAGCLNCLCAWGGENERLFGAIAAVDVGCCWL